MLETRKPAGIIRSTLMITALVVIAVLVIGTLRRAQLGNRLDACRRQAHYPDAAVISETNPGFFQVSGSFESVLATADAPDAVERWYQRAASEAGQQALLDGTGQGWSALWDIQPDDAGGSRITLLCP